MRKTKFLLISLLIIVLSGCTKQTQSTTIDNTAIETTAIETTNSMAIESTTETVVVEDLYLASNYTGQPYIEINNNKTFFTDDDISNTSYEYYSELDNLGRCGVAYACIGTDIMPTEKRGAIGHIKPSGWHTSNYNSYPGLVDGNYLYNRCHLIAYMLAGENDNEKNLITGTRYMNVTGMLPFEDKVHDYLEENTNNHVMYRVTPIFKNDNLVAEGVLMEAYSVEDNGQLEFCVFCYNVQPQIYIDYATGDNHYIEDTEYVSEETTENTNVSDHTYIINTNSKKIHTTDCAALQSMKAKNKKETNESYEDLIKDGYEPCGICHPESEAN